MAWTGKRNIENDWNDFYFFKLQIVLDSSNVN